MQLPRHPTLTLPQTSGPAALKQLETAAVVGGSTPYPIPSGNPRTTYPQTTTQTAGTTVSASPYPTSPTT
ncbi:MAG: hypothetical protein ACKV0T_21760 [Planctomycetales bacterium]